MNLIYLMVFCSISLWYNICFKVVVSMKQFLFSWWLYTTFHIYQSSSLWVRVGGNCVVCIEAWHTSHWYWICTLYHCLCDSFSPFQSEYMQFSWHCSSIKLARIAVHVIWRFFTLVIIFHVLVVDFCITMYGIAHSTSDDFFNISSILASVIDSNSNFVLLQACLLW